MRPAHFRRAVAVLLLSAFTAIPAASQETDKYADGIRDFEAFVQQQLNQSQIIGMSVAFEKDGYLWENGYGYADLEHRTPATAESSYRIASVTKPMTAVGILVLAEQGKLNLDAEVQTYVPYYPEKKWPVTIRQILGHVSGIGNYRNDPDVDPNDRLSTTEAVALFQDLDLDFQPGTSYEYSTVGYNLLTAVIEEVSGQSYAEFMRENVWGPLGMTHTYVDNPTDSVANRVRGYRVADGHIARSVAVNTSMDIGGAGARSTVGDLVRFAQGLSDGKLISDTLRDQMWTSMTTADMRYTGYGMGWSIGDLNGRFTVVHDGAMQETRTLLVHFPSHDMTVAVACNFEGAVPWSFVMPVIEFLLGESVSTPTIYTGKIEDDLRLAALRSCFNEGLAFYDRYQAPVTTDSALLQRAFAYLNTILDPRMKKDKLPRLRTMVDFGAQPVSGDAFTKVGSFIVDQLARARGKEYVDAAYSAGELSLFGDYVRLCKEEDKRLSPYRLHRKFEKTGERWDSDWSWFVRNDKDEIVIDPQSNPDSLYEQLHRTFKAHKIYPDFSRQLADAARAAMGSKEPERGSKFARNSARLYPNSDYALTFLGVLHFVGGDADSGRVYLTEAAEINPAGEASDMGLNAYAYQLAGIGLVDAAINILKVATDLHPKVANLYDSMGEMYLMKSDTLQAVAYYEKALRVDPNFTNARQMIRRIRADAE